MKKFVLYKEKPYLCTVFFMVLDLRLTEEGRREMPFFFCKEGISQRYVGCRCPSFFILLKVVFDLDAEFDTGTIVFVFVKTCEYSDAEIVVGESVTYF